MRVAGLALAGGRSSRFGSEKALALLEGRPLLQHVCATLDTVCAVVAVSAKPGSGAAALATDLELPVLHDLEGDPDGPLAGISQGLTWAWAQGADLLAILPCDTPRVDAEVVRRLAAMLQPQDRVAAAQAPDGLHALCAVLRVDAAPMLRAQLDAGEHPPIGRFFAEIGLRPVAFDDPTPFLNINTQGDLER